MVGPLMLGHDRQHFLKSNDLFWGCLGLAKPFFRIGEDNKLVNFRDAKPEEVLKITEQAEEQQKRDESTFTNISYRQLRTVKADMLVALDEKDRAKEELKSLAKYLEGRGVNKPVLKEITEYAEKL